MHLVFSWFPNRQAGVCLRYIRPALNILVQHMTINSLSLTLSFFEFEAKVKQPEDFILIRKIVIDTNLNHFVNTIFVCFTKKSSAITNIGYKEPVTGDQSNYRSRSTRQLTCQGVQLFNLQKN